MIITGKFPALRLRRNRKFEWTRRLIQESSLSASDLILPKVKPINNELNKLTNKIVPLKKPSSKVQIKSELEKNKKTN